MRRLFSLMLASLLVLPAVAHADMSDIRHADNAVYVSTGADLFSYQESVSPLPDSEHGWLVSLGAGVSYLSSGDWYFALDGDGALGDAAYNGALLASPSVPYYGTTHEAMASIDAKVGKGFELSDSFMATPYIELGARGWRRDLSATQREDYGNFEGLGGLMMQWSPVNRWVVTAYGAAGTTFSGRMDSGGNRYHLGEAGAYKVGGKIGYAFLPRWQVFTSYDYNAFRYVNSEVIGSSYEPSSQTQNNACRLGLSYSYR